MRRLFRHLVRRWPWGRAQWVEFIVAVGVFVLSLFLLMRLGSDQEMAQSTISTAAIFIGALGSSLTAYTFLMSSSDVGNVFCRETIETSRVFLLMLAFVGLLYVLIAIPVTAFGSNCSGSAAPGWCFPLYCVSAILGSLLITGAMVYIYEIVQYRNHIREEAERQLRNCGQFLIVVADEKKREGLVAPDATDIDYTRYLGAARSLDTGHSPAGNVAGTLERIADKGKADADLADVMFRGGSGIDRDVELTLRVLERGRDAAGQLESMGSRLGGGDVRAFLDAASRMGSVAWRAVVTREGRVSVVRASGAKEFSGLSFAGARLPGASLAGSTFRGCTFDGSVLVGADLSRCDFEGASLGDARMAGASFAAARMAGMYFESESASTKTNGVRLTHRTDLSGASFEGAMLSDMELVLGGDETYEIAGAVFDGATMNGARLGGASLPGCSFSKASLYKASFERTRLDSTGFNGARAAEAVFRRCEADGFGAGDGLFLNSEWEGCTLRHSTFTRTSFVGSTIRESGFLDSYCRDTVFQSAVAEDVHFDDSMMPGCDFSTSRLADVTFNRAQVDRSLFRHCDAIEGLRMTGSSARDVSFMGSVVRGSRFELTNMDRSSFRSASLTGTAFVQCDLREADFSATVLEGVDFVYCSGVLDLSFTGADLSNVRFATAEPMGSGRHLGDGAFAAALRRHARSLSNVVVDGVRVDERR